MIKVKNLSTNEITTVYNVKTVEMNDVQIIVAEPQCPNPQGRFFRNYPCMVDGGEFVTLESKGQEVACKVLSIAEGYELCEKGKRGKRVPKEESATEPTTEPTTEATETTEATTTEQQPEPTATEPRQATETADDDAALLLRIIQRQKGGSVDENTVRRMIAEELAKYAQAEPKKVQMAAKKATQKGEEVYCEGFKKIVRNIRLGYNVYMYGPAGSGKSHTAEQVAEALGLDYYAQTTIQFAHDVRGYGDAGGNFVDTPFYKAFSQGGLYFQDEYDRSCAEAAIVLNTALANGYYDFPVVGRVKAHPNFRFIAAGNTLMQGADEEYVTGQQLDASSVDRFATFVKLDYDRRIELRITNNDVELVDFVGDLRQAITATGIKHVVSYRASKYMADPVVRAEDTLAEILTDCTLKGLDRDAIREIYGRLNNKSSQWAVAMKEVAGE